MGVVVEGAQEATATDFLTHFELLTRRTGEGAVHILRFYNQELYLKFLEKRVQLKGVKKSLNYAWLIGGKNREEVLLVEKEFPEIHIHGGQSSADFLLKALKELLGSKDSSVGSDRVTWLRNWEKKFGEILGSEGLGYMLKLYAKFESDEGQSSGPYDQEGDDFLAPVQIAIVGDENSGKSTLFNFLIGERSALVSSVAGTTRDALSKHMSMGGYDVRLYDTAGVSAKSTSKNETQSIYGQSSMIRESVVEKCDVIISLFADKTQGFRGKEVIQVRSKSDLDKSKTMSQDTLSISSLSGEGMVELQNRLRHAILKLKGKNISPRFY